MVSKDDDDLRDTGGAKQTDRALDRGDSVERQQRLELGRTRAHTRGVARGENDGGEARKSAVRLNGLGR